MTGQTPEESCAREGAHAVTATSGIVAGNLGVKETNEQQSGSHEQQNQPKQKPDRSIQKQIVRPSRLDWLFIRYAIVEEGVTRQSMADDYGITPQAINRRKRAENWNGEFEKSQLPKLEELLVMRNEREIARILRSMEVKLAKAVAAPGEDASKSAAQPSDAEIGLRARAVQSLARAADTAATTKRKIKAHEGVTTSLKGNRKALADRLDRIAAKLAASALPGDAE